MFKVENLAAMYRVVGKEILVNGDIVSPRGKETREIITPVIHIDNPRGRLAFEESRKFNIIYAIVESLMISDFADNVTYFEKFNKNMRTFSDNGVYLHGNYGRRVSNYLDSIINKLKNDKDSRQAIVSIYDNKYDCYYTGKDTPCTLSLHFLIRDNKLNMITYMRSNDIIWGVPYDIFMFTTLQEVIANTLEIDLGYYRHVPSSLHVYKEHYEVLEKMVDNATPVYSDNKCNLREWRYAAGMYKTIVDHGIVIGQLRSRNVDEYINPIKNEIAYRHNIVSEDKLDYVECPEWVNKFTARWRR